MIIDFFYYIYLHYKMGLIKQVSLIYLKLYNHPTTSRYRGELFSH